MSTDVWVQVPLLAPNTFLFAKQFNIAGLCKGSTADSDSVCLGSNPSPAARKKHFVRSAFFSYIILSYTVVLSFLVFPETQVL